jgi:hypothetical protein
MFITTLFSPMRYLFEVVLRFNVCLKIYFYKKVFLYYLKFTSVLLVFWLSLLLYLVNTIRKWTCQTANQSNNALYTYIELNNHIVFLTQYYMHMFFLHTNFSLFQIFIQNMIYFVLYYLFWMICIFSLCAINTHYIHTVLVQDFVSGQACCEN